MNNIDEYVDLIERKAGKKNKYQYTVIVISFLLFMNFFIVLASSPFFEEMPNAKLFNITSSIIIDDIKLTKELCRDPEIRILNLTETPGYSLVTEFDFYCDDVVSGIMNIFVFGGVIIGMLLLSVFNEFFGRKNTLLYMLEVLMYLFA